MKRLVITAYSDELAFSSAYISGTGIVTHAIVMLGLRSWMSVT